MSIVSAWEALGTMRHLYVFTFHEATYLLQLFQNQIVQQKAEYTDMRNAFLISPKPVIPIGDYQSAKYIARVEKRKFLSFPLTLPLRLR